MRCVKIKKYIKPQICIPLTGKNLEEIDAQLEVIIPKKPDIIELRADFLSNISDEDNVIKVINSIAYKTDIPLLFTIRSSREGGEPIALNELEVLDLLKVVCSKKNVYMIDYELESKREYVKELLAYGKAQDKKVILSYHNFNETPMNEELVEKILLMDQLGADHAKVAVMPNSQTDVFLLLELTRKLTSELNIPITAMSMGEIGKVSRALGWIYGSRITFAVGAESSAPGQIEIEALRKGIMNIAQII